MKHEFKTKTTTDKTTCNSKDETFVSAGSAKNGDRDGRQNFHVAGDGIQLSIVDERHRSLCPDSRLWLHSLSIRNHHADGCGDAHLESCHLSLRRQRRGHLCEFEVSLVYILSSNLPVLYSETLSQKKGREATLSSEGMQTTLPWNSHRECFVFECTEEQFCLNSSLRL